ncbi:MAG: hypothetical protein MSA09_11150 [Lachnospiraceae bacterium]|nr:hypothetical protein [Lachnospiraceae bacterium]
MAESKDFRVFLQNKKIPVCVLDQKWHRLFAIKGKPDNIVACEQELNELLKKQGQMNHEIKELKKLKAKLMGNIVENMEGTHAENAGRISSKKLDEDKRLIDDINEKLEAKEDEILDFPREIDRVNKELMLLTVEYCYGNLRVNVAEIREISDWIAQVRIDLKKNIIKKQNREINSRQIYAYMHDLFGAEMMDVFDLDNGDVDLRILEPPKKKPQEQTGQSAADAEKQTEQKAAASDGTVTAKNGGEQTEQHAKENFETK